MRRHELSDEQFKKIEPILPGRKGHVGATAKDNRLFINGVLWIFKTGAPWRDLPDNPVKHGLVHSPEEWPHSSFCHYVEKGFYEKNWGSMKPITFAGMNEAE